jgi:hypothetical protein
MNSFFEFVVGFFLMKNPGSARRHRAVWDYEKISLISSLNPGRTVSPESWLGSSRT